MRARATLASIMAGILKKVSWKLFRIMSNTVGGNQAGNFKKRAMRIRTIHGGENLGGLWGVSDQSLIRKAETYP